MTRQTPSEFKPGSNTATVNWAATEASVAIQNGKAAAVRNTTTTARKMLQQQPQQNQQ